MNKIIAIHQPNYIPWVGYFYKLYCADTFVILDDVQFSKGSVGNRNKIKTNQETEQYLTVPVQINAKKGFSNYNDLPIDYKQKWQKKHLISLDQNYSKSLNFKKYFPKIENILQQKYECLADLNIELIKALNSILEINTEVVLSSSFKDNLGAKTERLVNLCASLSGNVYLSGKGGMNYQNEEMFEKQKIQVIYTNYKAIEYAQKGESFIPNLSVLDAIFNCDPKDIIKHFDQLKEQL